MMLAGKQGPRGCGAMPRIWPLLTLLALVRLTVNTSQIEAARNKCDSACRDCKKSSASQKLDCLTHARADRTSALGDCTPGRSGRSCRGLARQMLMRAWSECRQSATACRSCCKANGSDGCVTTTTVITPTTTTMTASTAPTHPTTTTSISITTSTTTTTTSTSITTTTTTTTTSSSTTSTPTTQAPTTTTTQATTTPPTPPPTHAHDRAAPPPPRPAHHYHPPDAHDYPHHHDGEHHHEHSGANHHDHADHDHHDAHVRNDDQLDTACGVRHPHGEPGLVKHKEECLSAVHQRHPAVDGLARRAILQSPWQPPERAQLPVARSRDELRHSRRQLTRLQSPKDHPPSRIAAQRGRALVEGVSGRHQWHHLPVDQ